MNKVGFYCWAGPGTIRMINLKYFSPLINQESLMSSYEYEYIKKAKEILGITDFWASYSWGFSEKVEKEDRKFLLGRVENFKKNKIKLHAYIQGTNLVYEDFKDKDWWCRDEKNRLVPYYRGRKMVCLNNHEFLENIINRIESLKNSGVDGVYIDNIYMGQAPLPIFPNNKLVTFAGCACKVCRKLFKGDFTSQEYLEFRLNSTKKFLGYLSKKAKELKLEFGTNGSDPRFNPELMYGYRLPDLEKYQDYLLFESCSFPDGEYLNEIVKDIKKPVFLVNYKKDIGIDSEYSQEDFNDLYSYSKLNNFNLCIKGSEFTTNGIWHNLNVDKYAKPEVHNVNPLNSKPRINRDTESLFNNKYLANFVRSYYNQTLTFMMESKLARTGFKFLQEKFS